MKKTTDGFEMLCDRYIKGKPKMEAMFREEQQRLRLAAWLREIRESAGISQSELARRIGTTASAICRLEDPDYEGHSLKTLQRIVKALGMGLELTLVRRVGRRRKTKAVVLAETPAPAARSGVAVSKR
jgi:transcriptional regulator with XRE-family HTH domain